MMRLKIRKLLRKTYQVYKSVGEKGRFIQEAIPEYTIYHADLYNLICFLKRLIKETFFIKPLQKDILTCDS